MFIIFHTKFKQETWRHHSHITMFPFSTDEPRPSYSLVSITEKKMKNNVSKIFHTSLHKEGNIYTHTNKQKHGKASPVNIGSTVLTKRKIGGIILCRRTLGDLWELPVQLPIRSTANLPPGILTLFETSTSACIAVIFTYMLSGCDWMKGIKTI